MISIVESNMTKLIIYIISLVIFIGIIVSKGDYIVTDLFGNRHVYDPSIFHELFKKY